MSRLSHTPVVNATTTLTSTRPKTAQSPPLSSLPGFRHWPGASANTARKPPRTRPTHSTDKETIQARRRALHAHKVRQRQEHHRARHGIAVHVPSHEQRQHGHHDDASLQQPFRPIGSHVHQGGLRLRLSRCRMHRASRAVAASAAVAGIPSAEPDDPTRRAMAAGSRENPCSTASGAHRPTAAPVPTPARLPGPSPRCGGPSARVAQRVAQGKLTLSQSS